MKLPTLYKKSSTGAIQQWDIEATTWSSPGDPVWGVIRTRHGQVGGKIQETEDVIKTGKNPGKKNATTASQQAELEAQAKWEKQLKKGYVKTIEEAQSGAVDAIIEGGISPMLAHRFDEQGHKIVYPAFAQPKFDGHRCIAVVKDGKASLWTRTRKPITGLPHIIATIEDWARFEQIEDIILDGELYNHAYRSNFEELTSFIRTPDAKPGHEVVQYHIYDLATDDPQSERIEELRNFFARNRWKDTLVFVETVQVADEDELMLIFENFLAGGYEGLMIRNASGKYLNKRSYDLQKVKEFVDDEFTVIGVEEGRGKLAGHAIFVCTTESGNEFRVKMKGETSELKKYWENPKLAVGRKLTVKYQGMTKYEIPRFPVALRFKEEV